MLLILILLIVKILSLGGYLSPPQRPPLAGLGYLLEHHALVLFQSTQFYINQLKFDNIIGLPVIVGI